MVREVTATRPRLLYLITEDWYFWSHRLDLARAARDAGFDVTIATRVTDHGERIQKEGFHLAPLSLNRRSRNPIYELAAVGELIKLYRQVRPHLVHHVAMKPILYGSLAAWVTRVPVVLNAFAGLGYVFTDSARRTTVLERFMKRGLKQVVKLSRSVVLVQNEDDRDRLVEEGIVPAAGIRIIAGSGVDIGLYAVGTSPPGVPIVMLPARMLWDKGVREFVEAARHLKAKGVEARFVLVGRCDEDNPAAIAPIQLNCWTREGMVEWWGHREDMPGAYRGATLIVLPSYREGLPKVLLEAAACGKAIVATDVPGCRDVVRHGLTGLLVPPRNSDALAGAIERLLRDQAMREEMGNHGREMAVQHWTAPRIQEQVLALYREFLETCSFQDSLHRDA
jgi:glycosyltransferase involved in cell wall biosynthesis